MTQQPFCAGLSINHFLCLGPTLIKMTYSGRIDVYPLTITPNFTFCPSHNHALFQFPERKSVPIIYVMWQVKR